MTMLKFITILAIAFTLSACENRGPNRDNTDRNADELRNETKEDLDAKKDNAKVEKEDYENKVQAYLDRQNARIDDLKNKTKVERGSARVRTNREINRLEKDRDAVKMRLDELKSTSAENWKDMRSDIDKMISSPSTKTSKD